VEELRGAFVFTASVLLNPGTLFKGSDIVFDAIKRERKKVILEIKRNIYILH